MKSIKIHNYKIITMCNRSLRIQINNDIVVFATKRVANQLINFDQKHPDADFFIIEKDDRNWLATPSIF